MRYALLGCVMLASALMLHPAAQAQRGPARASMERWLSGCCPGLPDESAESEVRHAVLSGCDGPLRTTPAEAIKSGEARKFRRFGGGTAALPCCGQAPDLIISGLTS
jgi:hypothetical protein